MSDISKSDEELLEEILNEDEMSEDFVEIVHREDGGLAYVEKTSVVDPCASDSLEGYGSW